ncbi:MAG: RNA methyltransferase [Bacteroidetes bacterium]|nr:RNA methyltransferase [Bacteroidota bacterium]
MLSKSKIKLINQLKLKKYRQLNNMFFVEGTKGTQDFLTSNIPLVELFATQEWVDKHNINRTGVSATIISKKEIKKVSALSTPSDVLAIFELPKTKLLKSIDSENLCIALDNISDPGNLGTIIRTADWFGINNIFCSRDTVDAFNPKVVQATMGSLARVNIAYVNLEELLKSRPDGIPVFGALLDGQPLNEIGPQKKGIILIGSEAHGISKELLPTVDNKITIPLLNSSNSSRPESLNASVATAIICYALKISS